MRGRKSGHVLLIWSTLLLGALAPACDKAPRSPSAPTPTPGDTGPPPPVPRANGTLAFVSTRDGSPFIYVTNADGSGVTRLASGRNPAQIHGSAGDEVSSLGSRMRIFMTADDGSERQVVADAPTASMPNYWDYQAVCSRAGR
jgi:Tol biopolymer transport system component